MPIRIVLVNVPSKECKFLQLPFLLFSSGLWFGLICSLGPLRRPLKRDLYDFALHPQGDGLC
jgi:hypothetical protein